MRKGLNPLFKRYHNLFKTKGYHDDRELFVNTCEMVLDLQKEEVKTKVGELALTKMETELTNDLLKMYDSLQERGMLN